MELNALTPAGKQETLVLPSFLYKKLIEVFNQEVSKPSKNNYYSKIYGKEDEVARQAIQASLEREVDSGLTSYQKLGAFLEEYYAQYENR